MTSFAVVASAVYYVALYSAVTVNNPGEINVTFKNDSTASTYVFIGTFAGNGGGTHITPTSSNYFMIFTNSNAYPASYTGHTIIGLSAGNVSIGLLGNTTPGTVTLVNSNLRVIKMS